MIDERGDVLRVCDDPSARKWAFALGVGGTVIVGWFFLVVALAGDDRGQIRPAVAVGAYCAAIAVAVGVFWNFTGGRCADIVFDRGTGVFRGRCWTRRGWRANCTGPLESIASLQICCREIRIETRRTTRPERTWFGGAKSRPRI